uniref:Ig-like domain-containing protein n=1 Tax=Sinocyclocheilus anshuiensis TaxID=1608454 RepID=A0A671NCR0_9TELE
MIFNVCIFTLKCINSVEAKPVVKVTPDQRVFRGETVTLTCDIQRGRNIQWTYSWFKDGQAIPDTTERVYTITSVSDNSGEYSCEAKSISDAVTLTLSGKTWPGSMPHTT